jgi:hypothetical protein
MPIAVCCSKAIANTGLQVAASLKSLNAKSKFVTPEIYDLGIAEKTETKT